MDFFPVGSSNSRRLTLATLSVITDRDSLTPSLAILPYDTPDHFLAAYEDA